MSTSKSKRVKRTAAKFPARYLMDFSSESKKAEHLKRFVCRALETHKTLHLDWFVDYGFEFPRPLISQNLAKFCTLSGVIYPQLVKKFYANLRKDAGCWITEVNGTRIEVDLEILEEIGGLKNSGVTMNDFEIEAWNFFDSDTLFANYLRPSKVPNRRKADLMKVNDYLLHLVVMHILLPRSFNKDQSNDEDMQYIFALKNGVDINWADAVMKFMIRRFNNPSCALPYPLLISKIIENAGVNVANELQLCVEENVNQIDRMTLVKMKIVHVNGSWQWLEDAFPEKPEMKEEMDEAEAEIPKSAPPSMENLMTHMEGLMSEHSRQIQSYVNARLNKIEERIDLGITLLKTLLGSSESTSHSPPNLS